MASDGPEASSNILLGNDVLSDFRSVTFDYPARQVVLEPNVGAADVAPKLYRQGRYYHSCGEIQRAIDAYSKSIAINPNFAHHAYYLRGKAYYDLQQYQKAIDDYNKIVGEWDSSVYLYLYRGCALGCLGKYSLAIDDFNKVLHQDPKSIDALEDRAWAYDKMGKHELAKADRDLAKKLESPGSKKTTSSK